MLKEKRLNAIKTLTSDDKHINKLETQCVWLWSTQMTNRSIENQINVQMINLQTSTTTTTPKTLVPKLWGLQWINSQTSNEENSIAHKQTQQGFIPPPPKKLRLRFGFFVVVIVVSWLKKKERKKIMLGNES